jgi:phosphohistidine phosphatase SixA
VWIENTLYAASAETLLERIGALPDEAEEVMLIAHNPGLGDLVLLLAVPGKLRTRAETKLPAHSRPWRQISSTGPSSSLGEPGSCRS